MEKTRIPYQRKTATNSLFYEGPFIKSTKIIMELLQKSDEETFSVKLKSAS